MNHSTPSLCRRIGITKTKAMMYTGDPFGVREVRWFGLVNKEVPMEGAKAGPVQMVGVGGVCVIHTPKK